MAYRIAFKGPLQIARQPIKATRLLNPQLNRRYVSFVNTASADVPTPPVMDDEPKSSKSGNARALLETALTTCVGILLLAGTGVCYHYWYKKNVLDKMYRAFEPGYDPVIELAKASRKGNQETVHIYRKEQRFIDEVVDGKVTGQYVLLLGPKGSGKTTLLTEAIVSNNADGVSMMEAHEDPEIFAIRLCKALDYERNEDSFAGLFSRREPREAGPLLDVERALYKLEKVAIKYRKNRGRPLVMIFNNIHFIHGDEEGRSLLHMLQQRAEAWAQAGIATFIFSSDDFTPYEHLKKNASRMHVLSITDLDPTETHQFLTLKHREHFPEKGPLSPEESYKIWDMVGGRLSLLDTIARSNDMLASTRDMIERERGWIQHRLGLIPDHDDDVMDEQKVSSCSFLLFQALANISLDGTNSDVPEPTPGNELQQLLYDNKAVLDPKVSYYNARQIMTRPDYIMDLDHHNIINVDVNYNIRPDSRLLLNVFREICAEEDFQDKLDNVRDRIDEIESLHRTNELTVKSGSADLGGILRLLVGPIPSNKVKSYLEKADSNDEDNDEKNT